MVLSLLFRRSASNVGIYEAAGGSFCNEEFMIGGERSPVVNMPLLNDCLRAFY